MRRQHTGIGGGDLPPYNKNLVFYAPLEYGDTTDNISHTDVTVTSPATLTYSQDKSMYLFNANATGSVFGNLFYWNTPELGLISNSSTVNDMHYTIHFDVIFDEVKYYSRCIPNISYVVEKNVYGIIGNGNTGSWGYTFNTNQLYVIDIVIDGNSQYVYVNRNLVFTTTPFFSFNGISNKNDLDYGIKVFYMHQGSGSDQSGSEYLKNIRIYNRALSSNEISKLYEYENGLLPSGYIQLEYLEGTGTQFIDTGVSNLGSSQRVVMDFSWVEAGSFQVNGFGNSQNGITVRFGCNSQNNFTYAAQTSGTWVYNDCGPVDTSRHVFDIQSGSQKFDGVQISSNTISAWNRNFYLFATNDQWVNNTYHVQYYCKCRIYNCKFYSDGVLVRDMIPALRESDFKPGLYDVVNDVFYTNLGTGEFVYKYNIGSYVKWLKSLGCVFYCAFDGVTGTNDLINNVPLTLSGNGSISYDSSLDMYSITTPSSQGQDIGYWDNGIGIDTFPADDFSALYTAQKITTTSGKAMHGVTPYSDNFRTCQALDMLYNGSGDVSGWPSAVTKVACSFSTTNSWRRYYQDGTLFGEYAIFAQFQPSNWVTSGNHLCLGRTPVDSNSSHRGVSLYIGKTYIFNTALDIQTIRKIQGYE